jgi:hypothetical protein
MGTCIVGGWEFPAGLLCGGVFAKGFEAPQNPQNFVLI